MARLKSMFTPSMDQDSRLAHAVHGAKTGIAAVLAYAASLWLGLTHGYWAALSAVIVMQVNVADSLQMSWYRFSGTAVGALIGLLMILVFPPTPAMTTAGFFLAVAFCAYMTRYNSRYRMAAITVTIVLLAGMGEPDRVPFALFRVLEIALGVACAFLVNLLVLPQRAGDKLKKRLSQRFVQCGAIYGQLMEDFLSLQSRANPAPLAGFCRELREDRRLFLKVLRHERLIYRDDTGRLGLKIGTLEKSCGHLQSMLDALNSTQGDGYEIIMARELRELAAATAEVMQEIGNARSADTARLETALAAAEKRLDELRSGGATRRFYLQKLMQFFAFYHGAQFMAQELCRNARDLEIPPSQR